MSCSLHMSCSLQVFLRKQHIQHHPSRKQNSRQFQEEMNSTTSTRRTRRRLTPVLIDSFIYRRTLESCEERTDDHSEFALSQGRYSTRPSVRRRRPFPVQLLQDVESSDDSDSSNSFESVIHCGGVNEYNTSDDEDEDLDIYHLCNNPNIEE